MREKRRDVKYNTDKKLEGEHEGVHSICSCRRFFLLLICLTFLADFLFFPKPWTLFLCTDDVFVGRIDPPPCTFSLSLPPVSLSFLFYISILICTPLSCFPPPCTPFCT